MAITNISVVSVPVTDQDRAKSFYTEKLGFSAEVDGSFGEGMRWVMLRPPGSATAITLVTWFDTSVIDVALPGGRSITQRMPSPKLPSTCMANPSVST